MLWLVVTDEADRVALGILHKRHPFVHAGWAEAVIAMAEDEVRLSNDLNTLRTQGIEGLSYIVDLEVDQCTRRTLLKQQAYLTGLKQQQPWRVEETGGLGVEQALVEGSCPRKIIGMLRDLQDIHLASVACIISGSENGY